MLGGYLIDMYGFETTFLITAALQVVSIACLVPLLCLVSNETRTPRPEAAAAAADDDDDDLKGGVGGGHAPQNFWGANPECPFSPGGQHSNPATTARRRRQPPLRVTAAAPPAGSGMSPSCRTIPRKLLAANLIHVSILIPF